MPDLQLLVRYKPKPLKPVYDAAYVVKWLTVIVIPCVYLLSLLVFVLSPDLRAALYSNVGLLFIIAGAGYFGIGAFLALCTHPLRDTTIKLSKDGIILPFLAARMRLMKSSHIWSEFNSASIARTKEGKVKLLLGFTTGQKLVFDADGFESSELEQFLLGVELWGTSILRSPELIDYQVGLQNELKGVEVNYTRMWEEELSRRFKATSFMPLEPQQALQNGRISVVKQLAFGGLSAIYLVQRDNNDLFVLKEAVVPADADSEVRRLAEKHLSREASILAGLSHDNIAKVVDYFVEDGRNYLLLEYISGQDLRQLVRQNGLQSTEKVLVWALQIAHAIKYLHAQEPPIIHRDISPDNIVLNNFGSVILIDFGASNEFIGTATGTLIGKQAYMAPEQLRGKATTLSDIYAFGACLYFLITGRDPMPLSACHPRDVLPDLSEELNRLLAEMTEPEQIERIQNVSTVISRLQELSNMPSMLAT